MSSRICSWRICSCLLHFSTPATIGTTTHVENLTLAPNVRGPNMLNCFTVDVEDYFQVSAFKDRIAVADWNKYESRVEDNTNRILSILNECNVRSTFFILGWVADRYPGLVKRIQHAGHEIGSHGYWHQLIYTQNPDEFADDIAKSKDAICAITGEEVVAYRAPSFSVVQRTLWALDILVEQGFELDSSIFPISGHDLYGIPGARKDIHTLQTKAGTITEFPPSAWHWGRFNIPIGGGYFRMLPLKGTQMAIEAVNRGGRPAMFYIHPWEVDPKQPRISGAGWKSRLRHYSGLRKTEQRIRDLLAGNDFGSIADVLQVRSNAGMSEPQLVSGRTSIHASK